MTLDRAAEEAFTVTVDINGTPTTVNVAIGQTTVNFTAPARTDDYYDQGETTVSAKITGVTGDGNFEDLQFNSNDIVETKVTDDNDPTTLTLSASSSLVEAGDTITYTLSLDNPVETKMTVTVNVNGVEQEVTIYPANNDLANGPLSDGKTASFTATAVLDADGKFDASIATNPDGSYKVSGGNFEDLTFENTSTDVVTNNLSVDEEGLSNGTNASSDSEITYWEIPQGYSAESLSYDATLYTVEVVVKDGVNQLKVTLLDSVDQTNANNVDWDKIDTITKQDAITVTLKDSEEKTYDIKLDVTISDDAPVVSSVSDTNNFDKNDTTSQAVVKDGFAEATIKIDFGADEIGSKIEITDGATVKQGVEWNGTTWESLDPNDKTIDVDVDDATNCFIIKIGDVTYTQQLDSNGKPSDTWEVSYEVSGRTEVITIFTDGDGDAVSHTIKSTAPVIIVKDKVIVEEKALSTGTEAALDTEIATDTVTITSSDGYKGGSFASGFEWNMENGLPIGTDGKSIKLKTSDDNIDLVW